MRDSLPILLDHLLEYRFFRAPPARSHIISAPYICKHFSLHEARTYAKERSYVSVLTVCFHQSRALIFQSLWGAAGLFILDFCFKFMCRRNALDIWRSKKGPLISDHCHQTLCGESRSLHWPWAVGCHVYRGRDCTISMAFQSVAFYYWFNHCCRNQMVVYQAQAMKLTREARGSWSFLSKNSAFLLTLWGRGSYIGASTLWDSISALRQSYKMILDISSSYTSR